MRDPDEGVGEDGLIITGVGAHRIPLPFQRVLDDATNALVAPHGDNLRSIYVYGSVATGQAVMGRSDLDLSVVVTNAVETSVATAVAADMSRIAANTAAVRSIGVGTVTFDDLLADTEEGRIERCFLHHYCLHVWGQDFRSRTSPCAATPALARGFAGGLLNKLPAAIAGDWTLVSDPAAFGRHLLMAAAMALSVRDGDWSTDRATAVTLIGHDDVQAGQDAAAIWSWADSQGPSFGNAPADHRDQLSRLGRWVHDAYRQLPTG